MRYICFITDNNHSTHCIRLVISTTNSTLYVDDCGYSSNSKIAPGKLLPLWQFTSKEEEQHTFRTIPESTG